MSVRLALLAILAEAPCYGNQLRSELILRTSGALTVNVGQVYNTLARLARDGLVNETGVSARGHVIFTITAAGAELAAAWLSGASDESDDLGIKIVLAASLPSVDVVHLIAEHDTAERRVLEAAAAAAEGAQDAVTVLLAREAVLHAEARRAFLSEAAAAVKRGNLAPFPLQSELPKRGRPRSTSG